MTNEELYYNADMDEFKTRDNWEDVYDEVERNVSNFQDWASKHLSKVSEMSVMDLKYFETYFDDIDTHIEMLEDEASLLDDCIRKDELNERIPQLKEFKKDGCVCIDNDVSDLECINVRHQNRNPKR